MYTTEKHEQSLRHEHIFIIATAETIVVRCCTACGRTWYFERSYGMMADGNRQWRRVFEPGKEANATTELEKDEG